MARKKTQRETDLFWMRLEAERHDLTYKQPKADPQPEIVFVGVRETKRDREQRDKLMFNAGRFAAGARDKVAVAAHEKLENAL